MKQMCTQSLLSFILFLGLRVILTRMHLKQEQGLELSEQTLDKHGELKIPI